MRRAAPAARPQCQVERDWARLALRKLTGLLATSGDDALVTLHFNGEVLMVWCEGTLIAVPASGKPWPKRYSLRAASLRRLPRRLMREKVEFSIFESALTIGNVRYPGVVAIDVESASAS
jgi:hypothetical protein